MDYQKGFVLYFDEAGNPGKLYSSADFIKLATPAQPVVTPVVTDKPVTVSVLGKYVGLYDGDKVYEDPVNKSYFQVTDKGEIVPRGTNLPFLVTILAYVKLTGNDTPNPFGVGVPARFIMPANHYWHQYQDGNWFISTDKSDLLGPDWLLPAPARQVSDKKAITDQKPGLWGPVPATTPQTTT